MGSIKLNDVPDPTPLARSPWDHGDAAVRIAKIITYLTAPAGIPLLVVRVETDQPGLFGFGCASSPQRPLAVQTVIENYLGPLLIGRNALDTEDLHALISMSPYWRGGAIENNAAAGIDLALWDIKGKYANLPAYQLFGGRVRNGVDVYGHAHGVDPAEVIDNAQEFIDKGYRYIRCQVAIPESDTYGAHASLQDERAASLAMSRSAAWRARPYVQTIPRLFERVRNAVGWDVELIHDVHERVNVAQAIALARALEAYDLYFLEDPIAPEDLAWFKELREKTTTPLAVGEVFTDIRTFVPLVVEHLIDFARVRMGAVGGLTPVLKLGHVCEVFGVRLAIHGPGDISPIGHAASIAIDATSGAFGIQESVESSPEIRDVFPGTPVIRAGQYEIVDTPGLGVEFDEREAAKYPVSEPLEWDRWSLLRREDGSIARP